MGPEYQLYLALGRFGISLIALALSIFAVYRSYQTSDNKAYEKVKALEADIKGVALVVDQVENFAKATNNRLAAYQSGKAQKVLGGMVAANQANDRDSLDKRIARGEFRQPPSESEVA